MSTPPLSLELRLYCTFADGMMGLHNMRHDEYKELLKLPHDEFILQFPILVHREAKKYVSEVMRYIKKREDNRDE